MSENPQDEHLVDTRTPGHAAHAAPDPTDPTDGSLVSEEPESAPIEADLQPRPEPVLNAAKIGGLIAALVVAVAATVSLVLAGKWTDINALGTALGGVAGAVLALAAYIAPVWQAYKARKVVTPLSDPRDTAGRQLVARTR
jgi:Flp pilus assembly pilin Flp